MQPFVSFGSGRYLIHLGDGEGTYKKKQAVAVPAVVMYEIVSNRNS